MFSGKKSALRDSGMAGIENVGFSYRERKILNPISLRVSPRGKFAEFSAERFMQDHPAEANLSKGNPSPGSCQRLERPAGHLYG
jgi:hypothetical protein